MTQERDIEIIAEKAANLPGYYKTEIREDGVYLWVFPAQGKGEAVKPEQVTEHLTQRGIRNVDAAAVAQAIEESSGEPVKVAPPFTASSDTTAAEVKIEIAKNRMEAYVTVPRSGSLPSVGAVKTALQQAGVVFGIDDSAVELAIRYPGQPFTVARGVEPVNGENARVIYAFDVSAQGKPVELEDGRVDFHNLNLINNVRKGDFLAEKIPPSPGTPGTNVMGDPLPAKPGKDIPAPLGKNVEVVDGRKFYATIDGQVVVINNKLNVLPVYEVKGDVDLSTGNIEFLGNVIVRGSVQQGFVIKAEGDVEVNGSVNGATIEGRNIVIRGGIQGMYRGIVRAYGNLSAKFIENATVYAAGDVLVSEAIMHSNINAGRKVLVQGKRGLIVGGAIWAGDEIRAKIIGSNFATPTEVGAGVNPSLREESIRVRKELKESESKLDQTKKALNILKNLEQQGTLPPDKREMLLKMTKAYFHLVGQTEALRNRISEIDIRLDEMRYGKVRAADVIHPGVKITIGSVVMPVRDPLKYVTLYCDEGEIKLSPYQ